MKNNTFRALPILAVVTVLLVVVASAASAMPAAQERLDPDTPLAPRSIQSINAEIGDDPDETGYTGPVTMGEATQLSAADPDHQDQRLPGERFSLEGEPDAMGGKEPEWTDFFYFFPAGSTLHPADSSVGIDYNPGACVNATGASFDFFTIYSHLPQGSRIDYLRIYYYDTSGSNSTASIRKYDGAGNTSDIGTVSSSGNGGFGTQLSPYIGHIVDHTNGSYVVNWQANVTGGSMQLCGLRVAYRLPS
jgi:hypothetical protein